MVTKFEHRNIASFIVSEVNSFLTKKNIVVVPGEMRELITGYERKALCFSHRDISS